MFGTNILTELKSLLSDLEKIDADWSVRIAAAVRSEISNMEPNTQLRSVIERQYDILEIQHERGTK